MKTLALVGLGHAHLEIVRRFKKRQPADTRLLCFSPAEDAAYSGLLPAILAGDGDETGMTIPLRELCAGPNIELIVESVTSLSAGDRTLTDGAGRTHAFDVCSIDVGSEPHGELAGQPNYVAIRPLLGFLPALREKLSYVPDGERPHVVVLGGGPGGVELAYTLPAFLERETGRPGLVTVVERHDQLLAQLPRELSTNVGDELRSRGVQIRLGQTLIPTPTGVRLQNASNGRELAEMHPHVIIDATTARAPSVLTQTDLQLDSRGFVQVHETLQTTTSPAVFAAGDCATCVEQPWPKSGVYAVRQAPTLWKNLVAALHGQPLKRYRAQKDSVKLLNRGDGTAWGVVKGKLVQGKWVRTWKDQLDTRFVRRYHKPVVVDEDELEETTAG